MTKLLLILLCLPISIFSQTDTTYIEETNKKWGELTPEEQEERIREENEFYKNKIHEGEHELTMSDVLQENGDKKLKLKDYSGAIKDYSESIEYNSHNSISHNNRGTVKYILKDYNGAIEDFSIAIDLSPETTSFYVNRGNARLMIQDYNGCLEDFYKAIEINPNETDKYMKSQEGQKYCDFIKNFCELGEKDCCDLYFIYCVE